MRKTHFDLSDESVIGRDAVALVLNHLQSVVPGKLEAFHHIHNYEGRREANATVAVYEYSTATCEGIINKSLGPV